MPFNITPITPRKAMTGVKPLGAHLVTALTKKRTPCTLVHPTAPKKPLAFQSRIPVAVPRHGATIGTSVVGAACLAVVKEEVNPRSPPFESLQGARHEATTGMNVVGAALISPRMMDWTTLLKAYHSLIALSPRASLQGATTSADNCALDIDDRALDIDDLRTPDVTPLKPKSIPLLARRPIGVAIWVPVRRQKLAPTTEIAHVANVCATRLNAIENIVSTGKHVVNSFEGVVAPRCSMNGPWVLHKAKKARTPRFAKKIGVPDVARPRWR